MKKRQWFRVLVDASGKAVDCRPVSAEGDASGGVFYFLATSASAAARLASKSHESRLLAARRARYDAEGRCKCGRERDRLPLLTCSGCDERHQLHVERRRAKNRGEEVPPLDRRAVLQERKRSDLDTVRFETLLDVQRILARQGADGLRRWLGVQIERHTKKPKEAA